MYTQDMFTSIDLKIKKLLYQILIIDSYKVYEGYFLTKARFAIKTNKHYPSTDLFFEYTYDYLYSYNFLAGLNIYCSRQRVCLYHPHRTLPRVMIVSYSLPILYLCHS